MEGNNVGRPLVRIHRVNRRIAPGPQTLQTNHSQGPHYIQRIPNLRRPLLRTFQASQVLRDIGIPAQNSTHNTTPKSQHAQTLDSIGYEAEIPEKFLCGISYQIMDNPHIMPDSNNHVDLESIRHWLSQSREHKHPFTGLPGLQLSNLKPDADLKREIDDFVAKCVEEAENKKKLTPS